MICTVEVRVTIEAKVATRMKKSLSMIILLNI